jgi:hypothetical protein
MKGKPDNELYCTITSIRVHGQGMVSVMTNSLSGLVQNSSNEEQHKGVCPSNKFIMETKYPHVLS